MDVESLIHAFFTSPGPGGVVVLGVLGLGCIVYYRLTRWILAGGEAERREEEEVS
jgi:hypothetical protein